MPNELLTGGPGTDATGAVVIPPPAAATTPATTAKLTIGGVEYEVPSALADSLRRDRDRIAGEYGSRLQGYERRLSELESANQVDEPAAPGQKAPDPRDLQYDPDKYHRENMAYTQHLVASATETVEGRRLAERQAEANEAARNAAWAGHVSKFYDEHPELKGDEDIVDTVWQRNFPRLKGLGLEEGLNELARLASARIVAVAEKGKAIGAPRTATLETSRGGTARRAPRQVADEEPNEPIRGGISAAIRAKQARFKMPQKVAAAA